MKKILSLGVASAVLSLTAVAASAAITPVVSDTAVEGEQVVVEVVANGFTDVATQFVVNASENLTLVDATTTDKGLPAFNADTMHFAWAGTEAPADGTVLLTLVFDVNAAADEEVTVSLTADAGFETGIDAAEVAATVVAAGEDNSDISDDTSDDETSDDTSDDGGLDDSDDTSDDTSGDGDNTDEPNPPAGVALAVVPAVLAGAAVVVAKKRK